ncbi:glycosyltransferase family 90 protein, partial [Hypoxylon sp. EC38]
AKRSTTLNEAANEYRRRYGIPPPPRFDKWYEYAISVDSPIIDDFTQIYTDLLPYWGISPALLRERTTHLLERPALSFGGLIIQDGQVTVSPHVKGTHKWMMDTMKTMIEPFAQWLPDMQLAFNLDDECRVSVPYEILEVYGRQGIISQNRLASQVEYLSFSSPKNRQWSNDFLSFDGTQSKKLWKKKSPYFQDWSKSPIFNNWIASTCPGNTAVDKGSWWNRKAKCSECSAPHMTDGVVSNWSLSGDLCHQPDLAYLHGFLLSPSAMTATHTLFPVFSQSRISNFADILYPSPWNFGDKVVYEDDKGISWHQKLNSVFWRGASSDGYATHGAWQTFLRARFVHTSQLLKGKLDTTLRKGIPLQDGFSGNDVSIYINVSFVGNFTRCDERDCAAESTTFYGSPTAAVPPSTDFQEHWRHRHLIDLDGAAFSGRFLPFLRSKSLPYRAALFRTWWEERVHAWQHFVPVDVRLGELWGLISYFSGRGNKEAENIAKSGSDWANKALRKEDMRVYMFRLLLEWGRIVNDKREELGY